MPRAVEHQNQTGVSTPTETVEVVTSQSTQVGVVKTAKSMEGEGNVATLALSM